MTEQERDPYVEWIARELRRPVVMEGDGRARIMAAVRLEAAPTRERAPWRRLAASRFALSPIAALAAAAAFVAVGLTIGLRMNDRDVQPVGSPAVVAEGSRLPVPVDTVRVVKFVLVAPHARQVAVVGDFNDWKAGATPMERTQTGGTWTASVQLAPGRHIYAFVVDGTQWLADPAAPLAPDDGFGAPSSVMLIGGPKS